MDMEIYTPDIYYLGRIAKTREILKYKREMNQKLDPFEFIFLKKYKKIIDYYIFARMFGFVSFSKNNKSQNGRPKTIEPKIPIIDEFIFDNYFLFIGVSKNISENNCFYDIWKIREIA